MPTKEEIARGTTKGKKNRDAGSALAGFGNGSTRTANVGWDDCPADMLARLVCAVYRAGGAVMFGVSADSGAISIQVFLGDDKRKLWFSTPEELEDGVVTTITFFEAL